MYQGLEANTFTEENARGAGFSLAKGAASLILTLKVVVEPVFSWDKTTVDHWPTGGGGLILISEFLSEPIVVATIQPTLGLKKKAGILSPSFALLSPMVMCRMFVQPLLS